MGFSNLFNPTPAIPSAIAGRCPDEPCFMSETHAVLTCLGQALNQIVVGPTLVQLLLVALLAGGHVILEGVPGTGKTLLVKVLATVVQAEFRRIQLTPDVLPSDITGTNILDLNNRSFTFKKGPVFTQVLLADEINRTPPKTQAALLEAMEEQQVRLDGESMPLPELFWVIATQNPIEFEGTYPLPEAQLDRFLFKLVVDYPDQSSEKQMLLNRQAGFQARRLDIARLKPEAVAPPLLRHRLILKPESFLDGLQIDAVIAALLNQVPVPR